MSRVDELVALAMAEADERDGREGWWWLSFADGERPAGQQFLGVTVVRAAGFGLAVMRARMLGINPGGEVAGKEIGTSHPPPEQLLDRLVTDKARILELEEQWCAAGWAASGRPRPT